MPRILDSLRFVESGDNLSHSQSCRVKGQSVSLTSSSSESSRTTFPAEDVLPIFGNLAFEDSRNDLA